MSVKDLKYVATFYLPIKVFRDKEGFYYAEIDSFEGLDESLESAVIMAIRSFAMHASSARVFKCLVRGE